MQSFPEIETDNILLRQIVNSDIDNIFKGLSHPRVIQYYGVSFKTLEETRQQMQWYKNLQEKALGIWWAICSRNNQIFYGATGINDLNSNHKKAEIGFWLLPEFWGMGIIKEALQNVIEYGFNSCSLHRIEAFIESENKNSKRVLEKSGFKFEGTMKDCEIKNDQFISLDIYAIVKPG